MEKKELIEKLKSQREELIQTYIGDIDKPINYHSKLKNLADVISDLEQEIEESKPKVYISTHVDVYEGGLKIIIARNLKETEIIAKDKSLWTIPTLCKSLEYKEKGDEEYPFVLGEDLY